VYVSSACACVCSCGSHPSFQTLCHHRSPGCELTRSPISMATPHFDLLITFFPSLFVVKVFHTLSLTTLPPFFSPVVPPPPPLAFDSPTFYLDVVFVPLPQVFSVLSPSKLFFLLLIFFLLSDVAFSYPPSVPG